MPTAAPVEPTATQKEPPLAHETAVSVFDPFGFGLGTTVHWPPSQIAIRLRFASKCSAPTAAHAHSMTQETPVKPFMIVGRGLGRSVQAPARRSTSVEVPMPRCRPPTPKHQSVETHDAPARLLSEPAGGVCS